MTGTQALIMLIIRIVCISYCVNKAGTLNRSKAWWGFFALFVPILAIIIIHFYRPLSDEEKAGY
jgi:hypothetical protein